MTAKQKFFQLVALCVTVLLLSQESMGDELCHLVRSGSDYTTEHLLTLISKFPSSHPKSTGSYCGNETYIPAHTSFPKGSYSGCTRTRSAEAYYSYNVPGATSANTGYEEKDTVLLYFIVDRAEDIYFVLVADSLEDDGDTDGGQLSLEIDVTPVSAAANVGLVSSDDKCGTCGCVDALAMDGTTWKDSVNSNCSSYASNNCWPTTSWDSCAGYSHSRYEDCYAFETSEGKGTFSWAYPSCCTDGMSLGPLPYEEFCFTIHVDTVQGLSKVQLGSWVESNNTIEKIELNMNEVMAYGLQWQLANPWKLNFNKLTRANCHAGIGEPIRTSRTIVLSRSLVATGHVSQNSVQLVALGSPIAVGLNQGILNLQLKSCSAPPAAEGVANESGLVK
ncbi:hypothetical protein CYMTET_55409 [Cymbomonas tetramitiformis]|uniref:Uncharacterized protein n=1 Tax=Cymbomonas tetramitiformis TaxID=36881 RepID=A0AAE0BD07_9CHLO|nr:hypothetical protein CYMTET_55409 [Cymbomonas tetramitiformis]